MSNSINNNIAAYYAQANITSASNAASASVARLSSGNRIVQASDDVTALAIGTSLGTQVSALKTAQTNASQGSSLLQVADGALAQIQAILQQQQSIANQAESGSLTDTDRGFLDQEFQALSSQINALANGTQFNGVNLIDGSIAAGGSTSSNPLQNTALVTSATPLTLTAVTGGIAGFTDVHNSANAGTTYQTGGFVAAGTDLASTGSITQPAGSYDKSLYGVLGTTGTFTVHASEVITGAGSTAGTYTIDYTAADGTVYEGTIATDTTGTIASGVAFTLTATTNAATHATITLHTGSGGYANTVDNSAQIAADLKTSFGTVAGTGVTFTSGSFAAAPTSITNPTAAAGLADPSLHGDLSQGAFTVQLGTDASGTYANITTVTNPALATGYVVTYTLNGTTYKGFLNNGTITNGSGTAGDLGVAASQVLTLASSSNGVHSQIVLTTSTAFGPTVATSVDQSANIKSALVANFAGATALNPTKAAAVTGETAQSGIGLVSFTSDPTKNDSTFVGDLSQGTFTVTGSAVAGYNISYSLNGSTYQGALSAAEVTNGGTLVLDNGNGSLAFAITGGATSTATSTALQTALTSQFSAATAHSVHTIATTLENDGNGGTIPGSAITTASTAGTLLNGFNGANVQLTSGLFDSGDTNMPPISDFTATGTGTSTVFSVIIDGTTYSTQGTVQPDSGSSIATSTFDGSTGVLNFYKNGDKTDNPSEVLQLTLTGIGGNAKIATSDEVTNFVDALNSTFGGGGGSSTGGLTFQLGTNSASNVTVNIASAQTSALFSGASLNVKTADAAATASTAVGNALNTVTASRASVGASESQFNFASAALQSSVQNQSAAESGLLDTDIAAESTNFATEQVKLQAGISVLAQANQQLQALLKLIG